MTDDPAPEAPVAILDLCAACVRFVERALGTTLDFAQETLPLLDHYLAGVTADASADVVALVAPAAGAYFGEVVRRSLADGAWEGLEGDVADARLSLVGGRLRLAPVEAALEAILGRAPDDAPPVLEAAPAMRDAVKDAFDAFGAVAERDFFRLSVRYDALVQAHAHVVRAARAGSNGAG